MDVIWPLETSYYANNYGNGCSVYMWMKATPVLDWSGDLINIEYSSRAQEVRVSMGNWRMKFGEFTHKAKCDALETAHRLSRKELLGFIFDYVNIDPPTNRTALAVIAAVGTLPGPIAEEIIPHLVMSLRTLTAQ